jgi:O-acetyl-ADP-ribose deacetylase (regulator of RNase III)
MDVAHLCENGISPNFNRMKTVHGDLIQLARNGQFDVIVHGCNCFCTMGAGIAKAIRAAFPAAYDADLATVPGSREKLGSCSRAEVLTDHASLVVVNAYTQFDWRGKGPKVDYDAVRSCMKWIKLSYAGKRIGLPKIGAGLAGGDWKRISAIVDEELEGENVTVVEFQAEVTP